MLIVRTQTPVLICILLSFTITSAKLSSKRKHPTGFYIDNGYGQTVAHRVFSLKQKREIARDIMNLLGIPSTRRRSRRSLSMNETKSVETAKRSASQFIHDVYRQSLEREKASGTFSSEEQRTISESDIIVTYPAIQRPRQPQNLWFDLALDKPTQLGQVIKAELHLYQKLISSPYELHIYEFVKPSQNEKRLQLVNAFVINGVSKSGWIKLNVTRALEHWLKRTKKTQRLRLKIKAGGEIALRDVICLDCDVDKQPFLVGYFESKGLVLSGASSLIRTKRSSLSSQFSSPAILNNPYASQNLPSYHSLNPLACRLHSLYVRFSELEQDSYIKAPDAYDAQFCSGQCYFPLNAHMNATNHALVQTLVRFLKPNLVPDYPCCAPRELDYLAVLYSTDNVKYVLKKYPNMVSKNCGCQ